MSITPVESIKSAEVSILAISSRFTELSFLFAYFCLFMRLGMPVRTGTHWSQKQGKVKK